MVKNYLDRLDGIAGTLFVIAFVIFIICFQMVKFGLNHQVLADLQKKGQFRAYYNILPPKIAIKSGWVLFATLRDIALWVITIILIYYIVRAIK